MLNFEPQDIERINWPMKEREIICIKDGALTISQAHWGLVPSWSGGIKSGRLCFNARSETVSEKPTFRSAFKSRRCLLVATAYGEWADVIEEREKRKQAVKFTVDDGQPFCYAGLWESWGAKEDPYISCTMITCEPNELAGEVHSRMPVILRPEDYEAWLDPTANPKYLLALLAPFPAERMAYEETTLPPRGKKTLANKEVSGDEGQGHSLFS
jgi:putative SOS response-associated peptidase YedK